MKKLFYASLIAAVSYSTGQAQVFIGPQPLGSAPITVGQAILGTCPSGYQIYSNAGLVGCQLATSTSIAISTSITGSTNGYGLYVNASALGQFAYGSGVFTALGLTLNGSGAIAATTSTALTTPRVAWSYATKSTSYQILATDYAIYASGSGNTQTLPNATLTGGQCFIIKNINANGSNIYVTVATTSSQTIDGDGTVLLYPKQSTTYCSDGSNWQIN